MRKIAILLTIVASALFTSPTSQAQTHLTWDPGTTQFGTEIYSNTNTNAGSYLFTITTTNTANHVGYWRSVLTVTSGEADLYISTSASVATNYYTQKSDTVGNDRITRSLSAGQTWYILVESDADSTWSLFAGDMHVQDLTWDPGTAQSGTEVFTNPGTEEGSYLFRIITTNTANNAGFWRTTLNLSSGEADLYTDPYANIAPNDYQYRSEQTGNDTIVQSLSAGQAKYILVEAEEGADWSLFAGDIHLTELTWDPGTADSGTELFNNLNTDGGAYYFKITTELADLAAWRTALDVLSGEADVFIKQNALPYTNSYTYSYTDSSTYTGDDGFTRYLSNTSGAGQEWYILVLADTGSTWNLLSGDVYAQDLGALATDASSSSGAAVIPPEGIRYFKTTIPPTAYAWRLWLRDITATSTLDLPFYIRKSLAPYPSSTSYYDRTRTAQGLLVPDYVEPGSASYYYVGLPGAPGDTFQLDSRQQEITDTPNNNTLVGQSTSGFLYKTYRIDVPPDQIAWEVTVEPVGGTNPDMAIRQGKVPNPFNNEAFSEVDSTTASDSTTLVPPSLSDGSFYVTVYGDADFNFNLRNREPVITQIDFLSITVNNDPDRIGWRYYAVSDIGQQLGQLGWLLELSNHVPGTEIAIRRNYVPGRWNYRQNGSSHIYSIAQNDQYNTQGFLQDPDHQADVWYIGIYSPSAPLGAFTLDSGSHSPTDFQADGHTNATTQINPQQWNFYHVDIPAQTNGQDVIGWELSMTSWSGQRPYMLIRRDQLPEGTSSTSYWYPHRRTEWISGKQWASSAYDWTSYYYGDTGQAYQHPTLSMGMGAPLEPGSYYVGFYNNSTTITGAYSFASSMIGTGMVYEVETIAFNGGSATITNLPAHAVEYFKVTVPSNSLSWAIELENTSGETMLHLREGYVPTMGMPAAATYSPGVTFQYMLKLKRTGDEHYVLLPENGQTHIPPGDYSLMIASEGQSPSGNHIGTGSASAILRSLGEEPVTQLGTLPLAGQILHPDSYNAGEIDFYQFDVPTNALALEITLESTSGSPRMYLRTDDILPRGPGYGIYSGTGYTHYNDQIITIANPASGTYSLTIGSPAATPLAGAYTLRVKAIGSTEFTFNGGGTNGVVLPPNKWSYYHVDIPAQVEGEDILGWELRISEWSGTRPYMMVRRDLPPAGTGTWYYPRSSTSWTSGNQWTTGSGDWTGYYYGSTGQAYSQTLLSMGMDRPLESGSYYVGFYNSSPTITNTFDFASSGIGTGMVYEVDTVAFNGGSADIIDLPAHDVAYFKVDVPAGQPSWRIQLENTSGETLLYVRKGYVPTWSMHQSSTYSPAYNTAYLTQLKKTGDEQFTLLPASGETTLPEGTYYLMVVSEGQSPSGSYIGTGTASATLRSHGNATVSNLGILPAAGQVVHPDSYIAGEIVLYQFEVPADALALEVQLEDRVGSPELNLRYDGNMPYGTSYGSYSGYSPNAQNPSTITVANPAPGTYSLLVNDSRAASTLTDGSYTLKLVTTGPTDIVFDGGGATDVSIPPYGWKYFQVDVPAQTNGQDVIGWELRTTQWSGSRPYMAVRRDQLPAGTGTWYYPRSSTSWISGNQWTTGSSDWSGYYYNHDGSQTYPQYLLSMGMNRPLSVGTYYIGFYNNSASVTSTVSFASSAIGSGMSYDPQPIAFSGGTATITNLAAHGVAYFKVDVPAHAINWKVKLENTSGETSLYIREGHVPTWSMHQAPSYSPGQNTSYMTRLKKADNEHYLLLPESGNPTIPPGTYYLMVASEGQSPSGNYIGDGTASAILHSLGEFAVPNLGTLPAGGSLSVSNSYDAGETIPYRFNIPSGTLAVELRLENVSSDPRMVLRTDEHLPNGFSYGLYSGYGYQYYNESIITIANPSTGTWSMVVGDPDSNTQLANGSFNLIIEDIQPPDLNFDASLNTNGNSNVATGLLENNQRDFYRVDVPETLDGAPVIGWYLATSTATGDAQIRVRKDLLPSDSGGGATQTPFKSKTTVIVPSLLTPGIWYVEVKGAGATDYTLTSSTVSLERAWVMPAVGEAITTAGLSAPLFGDSGVNEAGVPLPVDQGVDLDKGHYHFYAVTIPVENAGLFKTQLEAISGNPNLYIRTGNIPTLDHDTNGGGALYDRYLTSTANTEYGNWVPYDGRNEQALEAGTWYIMVKAEGANARYRLKLSGGNVYAGGNVQDLALDGGSYSSELLADNDWRHYRVVVPTNAPVNWDITYSQISGDVDLYIRDTVPAGNHQYFSDSAGAIRDWNYDYKNTGTVRPHFDSTGTHTLNMPPLRPGHIYYLSFIAKSDASFSVSSTVSGGTLPAYEKVDFETGFISTNLPAGATITYQVDVPSDAVRWVHSTTNTSALKVYLEQGSLPSQTTSDHRYWTGGNGWANQYLLNPTGWPWRPDQTYYFTVTNPGATPEPFILVMNGSMAAEIPQNITATDGTYPDRVYVNWASVSGVTSYEVWRNTVNDSSTATNLATTGSGSYYSDYSANPGQLYYYWASVGGVTNSAWFSNSDSGWVPGSGSISPTEQTYTAGGGTGTIDITAGGGLFWSASESLNWIVINSGTPGTNNGTVAYTVNPYAGNISRTGTITVASQDFSVIQEPFGVPTNVQASDGVFVDRTEITWDAIPSASRHYLYRSVTNDHTTASYIGYVGATNIYSDIGGILNRTYFYWVRPYNSGGYGSYSASDTGCRGLGGVTPAWIALYFPGGYPGDLVDSDGDGFTNHEEFIAGTIPTQGTSYPQISSTGLAPAGFIIHWTSVSGRVYRVNWTDSLTNSFGSLTNGIPFPQGSYTDTVHTVEGKGFYELDVELDLE